MRWAGLLLAAALVAACAGVGSAAAPPKKKPKPPAIRIVEPGPLALTPDGGLLVGDRRLRRVVRVDLRTRARRVVAARLPDVPVGLAFDDTGRLYVSAGERIFRVERGRLVPLAGTGTRGHTGDGGPATSASLAGAGGFEVDHDERIVIAEYDNWIRAVEPDGTIGTIAGTGATGYTGDGGPATAALLAHPHDIALRRDRQVVIADSHNGVLRLVDPSGVIRTLSTGFIAPIVVEGGPGETLFVADGRLGIVRVPAQGGPGRRVATARGAFGLAVDSNNTVYFAVLETRRVVRVTAAGRRTVLVSR
jgi:hypothetical protein